MQRVIICYKEEEADKVAAFLGVDKIEKVVYHYSELVGEKS